jgi:uncharacterized protein (DUF1330 family)
MNDTEAQARCYMIVFGAFTDLPRFLAGYQAAVAPLIEKFGGRYLLIGHDLQALEGPFPSGGGSVISVWPDRAAALLFWNSPEYAKVKPLREGAGQFEVVLVDAPAVSGF